jgi:hypothetical protein
LDKKESELTMEEQARINLDLTVAEINVILRSLGKHPFEEIAVLIQKIKAQGEAQLAELQAAAAEMQDTAEPAEPAAE